MALAVLLDPVGERTQAPVFLLGDRAAQTGDQFGELVGECLHLRRRDVLTRNEDVFVKCHVVSAPYGC